MGAELTYFPGDGLSSHYRTPGGIPMTAYRYNMVGGEISEYTKLMGESREQAIDRMTERAAELGADAIINVRLMTTSVVGSAAELLAYGTAVVVEAD